MSRVAEQFAAPTIPGPDPNTRTPRLKLPPGSCDCHAHLFGPQTRYRYDPKRRYTPPDASLSDWIPDAAVRKKVLVDNPQALYGF